MRIIENFILPPQGYTAITIGPFILTRNKKRITPTVVRHESIHWEQEKELLIVGFYLLYLIEFAVRLIAVHNWKLAYRELSFEREAYAHEADKEYISRRRHYAMWRRT